MPINVSHTPLSAIAGLATTAGQGQADLALMQQRMQIREFIARQQAQEQENLARQQAQKQAFAMQAAMAQRVRSSPTSASAAQFFPSREQLFAQSKAGQSSAQLRAQKSQLDSMRQTGSLDAASYDRAVLELMGGPKLAAPSTATSTVPVSVRRQPFEDLRRPLLDERKNINEWAQTGGWENSPWGSQDVATARATQIDKELAQITQQEQGAFGIGTPAASTITPEDKLTKARGELKALGPGRFKGETVVDDESGLRAQWNGSQWVELPPK